MWQHVDAALVLVLMTINLSACDELASPTSVRDPSDNQNRISGPFPVGGWFCTTSEHYEFGDDVLGPEFEICYDNPFEIDDPEGTPYWEKVFPNVSVDKVTFLHNGVGLLGVGSVVKCVGFCYDPEFLELPEEEFRYSYNHPVMTIVDFSRRDYTVERITKHAFIILVVNEDHYKSGRVVVVTRAQIFLAYDSEEYRSYRAYKDCLIHNNSAKLFERTECSAPMVSMEDIRTAMVHLGWNP